MKLIKFLIPVVCVSFCLSSCSKDEDKEIVDVNTPMEQFFHSNGVSVINDTVWIEGFHEGSMSFEIPVKVNTHFTKPEVVEIINKLKVQEPEYGSLLITKAIEKQFTITVYYEHWVINPGVDPNYATAGDFSLVPGVYESADAVFNYYTTTGNTKYSNENYSATLSIEGEKVIMNLWSNMCYNQRSAVCFGKTWPLNLLK